MNPEDNLISRDKLKDVLISRTATKLNVDTAIVEKVVGFAFKDAAKAFRSNYSVELSGFGVFKYSLPKLKKELKRKEANLKRYKQIEDPTDSNKKAIESIENQIADVKTKINELEKD